MRSPQPVEDKGFQKPPRPEWRLAHLSTGWHRDRLADAPDQLRRPRPRRNQGPPPPRAGGWSQRPRIPTATATPTRSPRWTPWSSVIDNTTGPSNGWGTSTHAASA